MGAETEQRVTAERALARGYFAIQAFGGALWWVAVVASTRVRRATLGGWDPAILVVPDLVFFVGGSVLAALAGTHPDRRRRRVVWVPTIWTVLVTLVLGVYGLVQQHAGVGVVVMTVASVGSLAASATLWFGSLPTGWFFVGPFSFREAAEAPTGRHLRRSLIQLVVFWTTFFAVIPLLAVTVERRLRIDLPILDHAALSVAGWVVFVAASALGLWSCVTMARVGQGTPLPSETARRLVVVGPFRLVRNPMAVAGAIQTAAVGLVWSSWVVIGLAVAGAVAWELGIRPAEEADLEARFGADYVAYRGDVRRWVPRLRHLPRRALP